MLEIHILENAQEIAKEGAKLVKAAIQGSKKPVLGLATGSSPVLMYQELVRMNQANELDFSNVTTVNLDEYIGLPNNHDQSYRYFMNDNLFNHINIDKENTFVPNGMADDLQLACEEYDQLLEELGPSDLQVLGIGPNGHIGFNEPAPSLMITTHLEDLKQATIDANARFFDKIEDVPRRAITMGLGGIFAAKKILVIATGEAKAKAVATLVGDVVDPQVPVSMLKLHPNVVVLIDSAAAKYL